MNIPSPQRPGAARPALFPSCHASWMAGSQASPEAREWTNMASAGQVKMVKISKILWEQSETQKLHVRYIYLHLGDFWGKCR